MIFKRVDTFDGHIGRAGITSCQFSSRVRRAGPHQAKVFRPVIGPDVEIFAVMRRVILDTLPARQQHAKFAHADRRLPDSETRL